MATRNKAATSTTGRRAKIAGEKKTAVKKATAKKTAAQKKKIMVKKAAAKKTAAQKKNTVVKKAAAKKTAVQKKKTAVKKAVAKKTAAQKKKTTVKKAAAKKTAVQKKNTAAKDTGSALKRKKQKMPITAPAETIPPYQPTARESYMSARQIKHFNLILQSRRQELLDEIQRTLNHMHDESGHLADPNDRATQEEEFALELRTRGREQRLVSKIDQAIERLKSKTYGYCEHCGTEIGLRRLEARPVAVLCIDCKELDEMRSRANGG